MYPRGVLRRSCVFVLTLVVGRVPAAAQGAPVPEIVLSAPPECPSGETLGTRLGDALAASGAGALPDVALSVEIRATDTGYAAMVAMREGEHEAMRELSDPSCALLIDAVALVIAVALVPELEGGALPDAPEPEEVPAPRAQRKAAPKGAQAVNDKQPDGSGAATEEAVPF